MFGRRPTRTTNRHLLPFSLICCICSSSFPRLASALPQSTAESPSIWQFHIANGPAPPRDQVPPAAQNANTDPRRLGPELGAIFGSYLIFVIFICTLILTVGRRLRRAAQSSQATLDMEILKSSAPAAADPIQMKPSTTNPWGPSPISPSKSLEKFWPSPMAGSSGWSMISKSKSNNQHRHKESMQSSVVTFDESVVEDDRTKNEIEMDRLYAAVAEHDAERSSSARKNSQASGSGQMSPLGQHPPELQHLRHGASGRAPIPDPYPLSPPPDASSFPPNNGRADTTSPPSRSSTKSPRRLNKPTPIAIADPQQLPSNAHSRNSSRSSFASFGKKRGTSIRNLPISPPMGSPDFDPYNSRLYNDTEPLTPHYASLPPPPPTPPSKQQHGNNRNAPAAAAAAPPSPRREMQRYPIQQQQQQQQQQQPTSPRSYYTHANQPPLPPLPTSPLSPASIASYNAGNYPSEPPTPRDDRLANALASPNASEFAHRSNFHFHPSIRSSRSSVASSTAVGYSPAATPRTATFPVVPPPVIREEQSMSNMNDGSNNSSDAALETGGFRFALDPPSRSGASTPKSTVTAGTSTTNVTGGKKSKPAPLSLKNAGSASNSQVSLPLRSATLPFRSLLSPRSRHAPGGTDIRAQEVTRPDKNSSNNRLHPNGPQSAALGTGVPMTPYSPYMPQTPLTPMTPSRLITREERKRMKKERGRRVLTQDDMVVKEEDMFGDAW